MRSTYRTMICCLMAALGCAVASGANTVGVGAASGQPGSEVTLELTMSGTDAVTAMEVRVALEGAATYVAGSAAVTSRTAGFAIQAAEVEGELRLYLYSPTLAPISGSEGAVASVGLRLEPTAGTFALAPEVVLGNAAGSAVECTVEAGSLDVRAPRLEIRTPKVDFGHVSIRSTYHSTMTVANTGNEPMEVSGLEAAAAVVTVSPASATIAPGESESFDVAFAPTERGAFSTAVEVRTDAVNAKPYMRWPAVEVVADPYSVNEVHVGRAEGVAGSAVPVVLRMNNMEPIVGAQVELRLPTGIDYVEGSAALAARGTDHTVSATVVDRTLTIVAYSLTNTPFGGDDGDLLSFEVMPQGSSGWYWLAPSRAILSNASLENMTSATSGEYVVIKSPTISGAAELSFGEQPVTAPLTARYALRNSGEAPLTVERVTFLAEGFGVATALPLEVAPGGSAWLDVEYSTEEAAAFATTMNIYSNDPTARMKPVALSGRAYSPNALTLGGTYSPGAYTLEVGMDNHAGISAVQFDLTVDDPAAVSGAITAATTSRTAGFSAMASKVDDGRFRVVLYSIGNQPIAANTGAIVRLTLPAGATPARAATFGIASMVLSTPSGANLTSPGASASATIEAFTPGDANGDGRLTVVDLRMIRNHILGKEISNFNPKAADANGNGTITTTDLRLTRKEILTTR